MGKVLTEAQIEAYHRDGFVAPIDVFSEDEALRLRTELEAAEARWPEAFEGAARNNAHLNIKCLDEIAHHPRIVDAAEDLIGPNILNAGTVLFTKEAHDPGFVSWHQDARYMGMEPHAGMTFWIALSHANEQSGSMRMLPGSHLKMQEHVDTYGEDNILTRGQEVQDIDESTAVTLDLRPGQMSIHSTRVLHSSLPNRSDDRRIGFVIQPFIPPEVTPVIRRVYAQVARGKDTHGHFDIIGRPKRDMDPDDVLLRDKVNAAWADVLYHGAEKRRNY